MFQVRIHGRGGQGVVSGAQMLCVAAFLEGRHAQSFPSFGSERMGASVTAFCRIDDREIRLREPVMEPDALIIHDPTLLHQADLFDGLTARGYILLNSTRDVEAPGLADYMRAFRGDRVCRLPATEIAMRHVGRAVPNVPLLAGFAAVSGQLRLASVVAAIRDRFPAALAAMNVAAAEEAYVIAKHVRQSVDAQAN
jgi:pyruvate ferredoxin oxidoreductase gamma subunit